ncbi:Glutamine amidotransferase, class I [Clostridiaceae bacterium JG1575]|nr:Glutamine amidotransferase, class I [Clostridiaceae bacterium JG1575]
MRPRIGITAGLTWEKEGDEFDGYLRNFLSQDYINAVALAGGLPLVLPVLSDESLLLEVLQELDGVVFSGGADLTPLLFGEEPRAGLTQTVRRRDESERVLLQGALERKLPIFGICRGLQLINAQLGGTLYQDLKEVPGEVLRHQYTTFPGDPVHTMQTKEGSLMAQLFGETTQINSHHHQALRELAPSLEATAWAPDGIIEAVEGTGERAHILGVQYHPEMMAPTSPLQQSLFKEFVVRAKGYREGR